MERLQSSLLQYWEHEPETKKEKVEKDEEKSPKAEQKKERSLKRQADIQERTLDTATKAQETTEAYDQQAKSDGDNKPAKIIPVMLLDEAHKLPALLRSEETMKSLLDSMLVLTKRAFHDLT